MVIRKYFALSLVAASLAMAGCSSDDDDDNGGTDGATTGTTTTGTTTTGTTTTGTTTTGGDEGGDDMGGDDTGTTDGGTTEVEDTTTRSGNSILDVARGTSETEDSDPDDDDDELEGGVDDLSALVGVLGGYPALLNLLDDETATLTVFAPNNAAIAALDLSGVAAEDQADFIENTLAYHVVEGDPAVDTGALTAEQTLPLTLTTAQGGTLELRDDGTGAIVVVDSADNEVATGEAVTAASNGVVYIIDSVLVAPPAPDGGDTGETDGTATAGTTDGGGTGTLAPEGTPFRAVQDDPSLSEFQALLEASGFDQSLSDPVNSGFVTFAPTNASIDPDATTAAVYIDTNTTLTDDSIPAGTYNGTGTGAKQFVVTGADETLMVNGLPASFVTRGDGGALVKFGE